MISDTDLCDPVFLPRENGKTIQPKPVVAVEIDTCLIPRR